MLNTVKFPIPYGESPIPYFTCYTKVLLFFSGIILIGKGLVSHEANEDGLLNFSINRGLPLTSILWMLAIGAAVLAAVLRGVDVENLLPFVGIALIPAIISLLLWPFTRREWAQMLVIFAWIALAIVACFAIAFVPMAVLFLLAPAVAALFEREKVVEAMVFSALFAAGVYYFARAGLAPEPLASSAQAIWGEMAGIMATIVFLIGAMFAAARGRERQVEKLVIPPELVAKAELAENFPGAVMKFDHKHYLELANAQARQLFDIDDESFASQTFEGLFDVKDADSKLASLLQDKKGVAPLSVQIPETVREKFEDEDQPTDLTLVKNPDGSLNVYACAAQRADVSTEDISQMVELAKRESDEKTLFFAGVSHELRTPLNAIIGFSDMMRTRLFGPLPGKYAEYADLIHESGQHMLDLVGDVLDMSKIEVGRYELVYDEFDIGDVIRSSVKMVRPSADAAELMLDVDIDPAHDLILEADRRAVRQMLLNLLSNAIKFTPKGGRVSTTAFLENGQIVIKIKDNGIGMSEKDMAKIGQAFHQAEGARLIKARSSGLGLSLVKNLVKLHKGTMDIKSHPGSGTEITLTLPVHRPDEPKI